LHTEHACEQAVAKELFCNTDAIKSSLGEDLSLTPEDHVQLASEQAMAEGCNQSFTSWQGDNKEQIAGQAAASHGADRNQVQGRSFMRAATEWEVFKRLQECLPFLVLNFAAFVAVFVWLLHAAWRILVHRTKARRGLREPLTASTGMPGSLFLAAVVTHPRIGDPEPEQASAVDLGEVAVEPEEAKCHDQVSNELKPAYELEADYASYASKAVMEGCVRTDPAVPSDMVRNNSLEAVPAFAHKTARPHDRHSRRSDLARRPNSKWLTSSRATSALRISATARAPATTTSRGRTFRVEP
jgi:hypothetical protein